MARHAQPRELAELSGATAKNPQRYKGEPPKSAMPLGEAPEYLSSGAQEAWFEISTYAPPNVLTGADRLMLEMACELTAEFREEPRKFNSSKMAQLVGMLARFGMSPADRQKLSIEQPKEQEDDFEVL